MLPYLSFLPPANVVSEGYVFTPVCDSVNGGGMCGCSGGACMVAPGGVCMDAPRGCAWLLGGHAWLLQGGAYMVAPKGHAWDAMRYGDTVNEWAVRILLE